TSQSTPSHLKPRSLNSSTVGVSHCSRRATSISEAPASASPSAISCPKPREPPVTRATFPLKSKSSFMSAMISSLILNQIKNCRVNLQQRSDSRYAETSKIKAESCKFCLDLSAKSFLHCCYCKPANFLFHDSTQRQIPQLS